MFVKSRKKNIYFVDFLSSYSSSFKLDEYEERLFNLVFLQILFKDFLKFLCLDKMILRTTLVQPINNPEMLLKTFFFKGNLKRRYQLRSWISWCLSFPQALYQRGLENTAQYCLPHCHKAHQDVVLQPSFCRRFLVPLPLLFTMIPGKATLTSEEFCMSYPPCL